MTDSIPTDQISAVLGALWSQHGLVGFMQGDDVSFEIHCLSTGKVIAEDSELDSEVIQAILANNDGDIESSADDLAVRLVGCMRPSLAWIQLSANSLNQYRTSRPAETMAYLLNMFFKPAGKAYDWFPTHKERTVTFRTVKCWHDSLSSAYVIPGFDEVLHNLLDLDARLGLHNLTPPKDSSKLLNSRDYAAWVKQFSTYYESQLAVWRKAQAEARYMTANPLAKQAFFESWMTRKPPSKAKQAATLKNSEADFLKALILSMESGNQIHEPAAHKPIAAVIKPQTQTPKSAAQTGPLVFGIKGKTS